MAAIGLSILVESEELRVDMGGEGNGFRVERSGGGRGAERNKPAIEEMDAARGGIFRRRRIGDEGGVGSGWTKVLAGAGDGIGGEEKLFEVAAIVVVSCV
jgi:hypothetical protein